MNARSTWRTLVIASVVAGCSMTAPPPATPSAATRTPPPARATFAAPPTPEPTIDPQPLPSTTKFGWWGDFISYCQPPAFYRLEGKVESLGSCPGLFLGDTKVVTLDVGQGIELHMNVARDGARPYFPLPEPEDPLVAVGVLIHDEATMNYRALSPGTTRLIAEGSCESYGTPGSCAVLEVHVRDIETECVDLPDDLCRAAGAAAVGIYSRLETGQRIAGWTAEPDSLTIEWPGCGHVVAKVTLELRDPAEQPVISLGQPDATNHPLALAWCTY